MPLVALSDDGCVGSAGELGPAFSSSGADAEGLGSDEESGAGGVPTVLGGGSSPWTTEATA
ncbi:hypothetical protein ACFQ0X_38885 [Streptomyces rectiviolaceus]|uniref:hypothetical protein n=1 Tax=Streptomyces rectiviolaceus TaxID=332591 RepID=UPI0036458DE9